MASDEYRPRAQDHLVEPMFGGLGVEGVPPEAEEPPCAEPAQRTRLGRALAFIRRLLNRAAADDSM